MRVPAEEESRHPRRVVVLGNFDGVHRGHVEVARAAAAMDLPTGAPGPGQAPPGRARLVTFHPHPAQVLGRGVPPLLTSRSRKRELVDRIEPPIELFEQTFDRAFAAQSPREFAELLVREHGAHVVVVGEDFRFGQGRAGDFATLVALGCELGFEARALPLVTDAGGAISSTRIRGVLAAGEVEAAIDLLGRPHMVEGVVEPGRRLGRTIGFPTCNTEGIEELVPPLGIYATLVDLVGPDGRARALARGATSVGTNPTVDASGRRTVETYLFDGLEPGFERELYGERLRVHFVARLRSEERFDGVEALVRQMRKDVARAGEVLAGWAPGRPPPELVPPDRASCGAGPAWA